MGVPTTVALALAGYMFTYYNSKVTEERKARIERINEQVKELYGPLLAVITASKSAFDAMVRQHSADGSRASFIYAAQANPESKEGQTYRHWMKTVLQPLNEKAAKIVTEHADLLEGASVEPLLLQLVAHVSAYKVILERWDAGDVHEWSAISYPDKLLGYITQEFQKMKTRQAQLLGIGQQAQGLTLHGNQNDGEGNESYPPEADPSRSVTCSRWSARVIFGGTDVHEGSESDALRHKEHFESEKRQELRAL